MEHPIKDFFNVAEQVNEIGQKTNKWEEKLKLFNQAKILWDKSIRTIHHCDMFKCSISHIFTIHKTK